MYLPILPTLVTGLLGWVAAAAPSAPAPQKPAPAGAAADPAQVDEARDRRTHPAPILDQRKLRQAMSRLASQHADIVSVLNVGESRTGSKIEALRIAAGEIEQGRPAILVVANLDGPLLHTSAIALAHAQSLVDNYGTDERTTALIDTTTIYIIPRANPDAAEGYFASPRLEIQATGYGVDDDRDGRSGEDGPEDINGNDLVGQMRIPDPDGTWIEDPTDTRALIEAEVTKGQRGRWKLVREGRDHDADGEACEDPRLDAWVNRNFASDWEEHSAQAGQFPTDEPEVRGLCEFVLSRNDIQLVVVYGELHNMGGKLKTVKDDAKATDRIPAAGLRESDAEYIEELGELYRKVTDNEAASSSESAGTFQRWCYAHRGLLCVEIAPWSMPLDTKDDESEDAGESAETAADESQDAEKPESDAKDEDEPEPSDDAKRLKWIDAEGEAESWRHLGWTPYEHPELGPVELGGFAPFGKSDPPEAVRTELAEHELEFLLQLGQKLAMVAITDAHAKPLGGGLLEVEATIENSGFLPLLSTWGKRTRSTRPALVVLHLPKGAQLLAGARTTQLSDLDGSGGHKKLRWLVRGANAAAIGIHVETDHAGATRAIPEVQR
ncbi:MAG: hypothetical protein ACI8QZ_003286 [Chlamydiales bacterium]|jgi:hypothetical protein